MMNRSEENQNGCREQTRNEDEGIREEYVKINNFDKSQTGQLMNRYRKITLCKDCRYRAKGKSGHHYCRGFGLPAVQLRENDGCSRGEER